ncbi:MAG: hypothetical protein QM613_01315 [Micrococcaceae bacterium]
MKIKRFNLILLTVMAIIFAIPLFSDVFSYYGPTWDSRFTLSRILGLDTVWTSPVSFSNFGHHGSITNEFYPWHTFYPVYLFFKMTGNLLLSYKLYVLLVVVVGIFIAYYSIFQIKKDYFTATVFSLVYIYSSVFFWDMNVRVNVGEGVSYIFLPLVLLGCYKIFVGDYSKWYILTIAMVLTTHTHILSATIFTTIVGVALIFSLYFWQDKRQRIFACMKAAIWSLLLSLGVLGPLLQQNFAMSVYSTSGSNNAVTSSSGVSLLSMLLNRFDGGLGLSILLVLIFTIYKINRLDKTDRFIFGYGLVIFVFAMMMSIWLKGQDTSPTISQFVIGLNTVITLCFAYSFSVTFTNAMDRLSNISVQIKKIGALSIILLVIYGNTLSSFYHWKQKDLAANGGIQSGKYLDSKVAKDDVVDRISDFYYVAQNGNKVALLVKDNHKEVGTNSYYMNGTLVASDDSNAKTDSDIGMVSYTVTPKLFTIDVGNNLETNVQLITPVYRYLGQKVLVNGTETSISVSKFGTTEITVPPGGSVVKITYSYTKLAILSKVISFLALLFLAQHLIFPDRDKQYWQRILAWGNDQLKDLEYKRYL